MFVRRKKKLLFLFFIIFSVVSHNILGFTLINPSKIKKFLEYKGRHNKKYFGYDEECESLLWNYADYESAPWSFKKMCRELVTSECQDYKAIRDIIEETFNKVAEDNKKLLEKKILRELSEKEIQDLVYATIKVRNYHWINYYETKYPQEIISHLYTESKKDNISKKFIDIKNGYELIKAIGYAVALYYDPDFIKNRLFNGQDEMFEKEPDYFLLIHKNSQNNKINIISLSGYKQDMLYKDNRLYKLLAEANWLKKKDKTKFSYRWKLFLCAIPGLVRFSTMSSGVCKKYEGIKKKMAKTNKVYEDLKNMSCPELDEFYWQKPKLDKELEKSEKIQNCYEVYKRLKPKKKFY